MRLPLEFHAFRKLLVQKTDETKRQMLFLSLAQEEAKLKALLRALSAKCGRECEMAPNNDPGVNQVQPADRLAFSHP
jgi:hypothetical protein